MVSQKKNKAKNSHKNKTKYFKTPNLGTILVLILQWLCVYSKYFIFQRLLPLVVPVTFLVGYCHLKLSLSSLSFLS